MISFEEAYKQILANSADFGMELIPLENAIGRVLAEDILADRDFPPFNRVTKDGIALSHLSYANGLREFTIQEIAPAGSPQKSLENPESCIEVMTGAILPKGADTVVMYENLDARNGIARIKVSPTKGQDIHSKGADCLKGTLLLSKNNRIDAAEIGILATVGKSKVLVKKHPRIVVFSSGNELVNIEETPQSHQIRKSNIYTLQSALLKEGIRSNRIHCKDDSQEIFNTMANAIDTSDVVLISGGVSKGKYDHLPEVLEKLGVVKQFHGVRQRPGKPFWFGKQEKKNVVVFAFPGNPASTFANFHIYFVPWLMKSYGLPIKKQQAILSQDFKNPIGLTLFSRTHLSLKEGRLYAQVVPDNGSGDLTSLSRTSAFMSFEPHAYVKAGSLVSVYPTKKIF